jgi:hypothetical protein
MDVCVRCGGQLGEPFKREAELRWTDDPAGETTHAVAVVRKCEGCGHLFLADPPAKRDPGAEWVPTPVDTGTQTEVRRPPGEGSPDDELKLRRRRD